MQGLNVLLDAKLFYIKLSSRVLQTPDKKNKKILLLFCVFICFLCRCD